MKFECYKCGHRQSVSKRKIKGSDDYWRCSICMSWIPFPHEFKGGVDNRPPSYKKRYKWYGDNVIRKKKTVMSARRDK